MPRAHLVVPCTLLAALAWWLYFQDLGALPFYAVGEPREALQVQDAIDRGDWVLPRRNGTEIPSKPPFFHWLGAIMVLLTGRLDELALRLPSALAATATVFAVAWFGARHWGAAAGFYAAFILATCPEWIRYARGARVDMVLTACLTFAFIAFDLARRRPSPRTLGAFYIATGLAALAKGPLGFALPVLTAAAFLAVRGELGRVRQLRPVAGLALAAAIPATWYALAVANAGMAFIHKQVWTENILQATGPGGSSGSQPFYYYVPNLALGMAPWSVFLVPLGVFLWRARRRPEREPFDYPLVWFAVVVLFFTIARGKRSHYILSAYPAAALVLGAWWSGLGREARAPGRAERRLVSAAVVVLVAATAVLLLALAAHALGADPLAVVAPYLHRKDRENLPLVREVLDTHGTAVVVWAAALVGAAACFAAGAWRRRWVLVFAALVLYVASTTAFANGVVHPRLARDRSYKPFMLDVSRVVGERPLFFFDSFDYGAVFYARRRIPVLQGTLPADPEPIFLIMTAQVWERFPPADRPRAALLARSEGTGADARDPLVLVRIGAAPGP